MGCSLSQNEEKMETEEGQWIERREERRGCFHLEIQKNKCAEGKKNHAIPVAGLINVPWNT